jgi:arylsulfatase A-like enzyme
VDNLLELTDRVGMVPSASRRSMTNRSQTPFLSQMVRDIYEHTHDQAWLKSATATLETEYSFWMSQRLSPCGLNRQHHAATTNYLMGFYHYLATQRFKGLNHTTPEEKLAFSSQALSEAETWDFTPRYDRRAEDFCPVDQNSNLYIYEENFAFFHQVLGTGQEALWRARAEKRKQLIQTLLWNDSLGCYTDYDWANKKTGDLVSCATLYPLLAGIASKEQAEKVVRKMREVLEFDHGLATCEKRPQKFVYQWDYPNAWPPLQLLAIQALDRNGFTDDAQRIASKYVRTVIRCYAKTKDLWEKYNAVSGTVEVVDEYQMPRMMGWTAGTFVYAAEYLFGHDFVAQFPWQVSAPVKAEFPVVTPPPVVTPSPPVSASGNTSVTKPNIVYVLADDLGYGDLGCYNNESKLPTPRIDQLAKQGIRFTDMHSASACTPTRYAIMTGRYAWRSRVPVGVLNAYDEPLIEAGRLTTPELLRKQGYLTACIGKWHLGWDWPKKEGTTEYDFTKPILNGPTSKGFDYYFGTHVPNQPPFAFIENNRLTVQPTATFPGKDRELHVMQPGPMAPGYKFEDIIPTHAGKVKQYLEARAQDKKPFFLYYTMTIPHEPLAPTTNYLGRSRINRVGDLILEMDALVGQVMDTLDRTGLTGNTLLIFTSDNGHGPATGVPALLEAGHNPSRPYRGYKGNILEGGHRIPFMAHWPGQIKPGTECQEPTSLSSLMATCADMLKVPLPKDAGEDSFSILPILLGQPQTTHPYLVHATGQGFAVRRGPWKYVEGRGPFSEDQKEARKKSEPRKPGRFLFNVNEDPAEQNDVLEKNPQVATELKPLLDQARTTGRTRP